MSINGPENLKSVNVEQYKAKENPNGESLTDLKSNNVFEEAMVSFKNLGRTEAGNKAVKMDAQDGTIDGHIDASVWNAYAEAHGGKTVTNYIGVKDAMDSIVTYTVKEQTEAAKEENQKLKENNDAPPEMGV